MDNGRPMQTRSLPRPPRLLARAPRLGRSIALAVLGAAALLALAGCGNDGKFLGGSASTPTPPPIESTPSAAVQKMLATPGQQNVKAITLLNAAVASVESCGTRTGNYSQCVTAAQLGTDLTVALGTGIGQAKISGSQHGYKMSVRAATGSNFTLVRRANGDILHSCVANAADASGVCSSPGNSW